MLGLSDVTGKISGVFITSGRLFWLSFRGENKKNRMNASSLTGTQ
jgi:hypothetical protein